MRVALLQILNSTGTFRIHLAIGAKICYNYTDNPKRQEG